MRGETFFFFFPSACPTDPETGDRPHSVNTRLAASAARLALEYRSAGRRRGKPARERSERIKQTKRKKKKEEEVALRIRASSKYRLPWKSSRAETKRAEGIDGC